MKMQCPNHKSPQNEKGVERDQHETEIGAPIEAIKDRDGKSDMECTSDAEEVEPRKDRTKASRHFRADLRSH
ncbi:Hypothetical predicted protein [Octopus vulgaris]|uniref:Uncharacterized protein n=1 Tax=Octopus vulgaris TaxID=6645 RepID=A0AA36EZP8_OCTVU|nr:Hypothetical predicted protein [Octopus vulgaris]